MKEELSVPALLLPALLKTGMDFDVDAVAILKRHGIDLKTLAMDSGRIPADRFHSAMEELAQETENPALGLSYAHHFGYDYIPEMASYLMSANTLFEAMDVYIWMAELFGSFVHVYFESDEALYTVRIGFALGTPYWVGRLFAECSFAMVARISTQKVGPDFKLAKVCFSHNDQSAVPVYKNAFRCPVSINQDFDSISIPLALVHAPVEQHSPALKALSKFQVEKRISELSGDKTIAETLQALLTQHPYLMAQGIDGCASHLYLTGRTLQRKLKHLDTNYREVCDSVKRELAMSLLEGKSSIDQISDLLCFSDRRSFTRAFQKWEGMTPSAYRKHLHEKTIR